MTKVNGTSQTGRDIGASVLLSSGTGTGQLDFTSGVVKANLVQILGTALTETAGYLAAGFKKFFNIASPVATVATVDQTGDSFARIGATGSGLSSLATAAELAKVPKSDSTVSWNATALAAINAEVDGALNTAIPGSPTANSVNERLVAVDDHVTADYGSTEKAAIDLLDDANGLVNIHDTVDTVAGYLDTEIAAILADTNELQTDWHDGGRLDLLLDGASAPSAATVADAVWDEAIADHLGAGKTGAALNAAGSAGDPWATAIPGAYGAGTAGKILGDNVNAPIGTVDTVVDAIKAKTDNLPSDPADQSAVEAAITAAHATTNGKIDAVDDMLDTELPAITAAVITNAAGVDIAADIIAVKADTAAILIDTGTDGVVLAADAITAAKIADNAIAAEHIADDAIVAANLATGCITADAFAADAIVAATLATDAITDDAIATGAIASTAFAAGAINAAAIADSAIDLATFAADAKTGSALKANVETVTNGAITAAAVATNAIDADALAADALAEIGLAVLNQALATSDADALNARTVRSALRALRNKTSIAAGTLTVTKEDVDGRLDCCRDD